MTNSIPLVESNQLAEIKDMSTKPHIIGVLIFKHSTRCSVSYQALKNLQCGLKFSQKDLPVFYLDVLKFRSISNAIAASYGVQHESPQLLFIKNGACTGNASHSEVSIETIEAWINA